MSIYFLMESFLKGNGTFRLSSLGLDGYEKASACYPPNALLSKNHEAQSLQFLKITGTYNFMSSTRTYQIINLQFT